MATENDRIASMMRADAAPGAGAPQPDVPPSGPMSSPMSTPEPKMGEKETAAINVQTAMDLLEQSLPKLGGDSDEGKAVMDAVDKLAKVFGKRESKTRELMPTEIMNMISALPQAGGATPEQKVAAQAPVPGTQTPPLPI